MVKHVAILGVLCILCSCASGGAPASVDWSTLENEAPTVTGPLQFRPEIEPLNLRIDLFHAQSTLVGMSVKWNIVVGGVPLMQSLGVDLGNGLAIDAGGNVFLDVVKLLKIDLSSPFRVEQKPGTLLGSRTTLVRDAAGMTLRSPRGRGTITMTDTGISLKNAAGKDDMTVKFADNTWSYHSTIAFDSGIAMKVAPDKLTISGPVLLHSLAIGQDGESVVFNSAYDYNFPQYIVTKQGDSYSIRYKSDTANVTFKLYFTTDAVYLTQNGAAALTVKNTGSSLLVNGKEVVTYSRG
jgi:hypothetical protein